MSELSCSVVNNKTISRMKKTSLFGLILSSFLILSNQVADDLSDLRLSFQLLSPVEVSEDQVDVMSGLVGDSIALNIHFHVLDTLNIDSIELIIESDSTVISESNHSYLSYSNDFESGLYRDGDYMVTNLGVYPFDSLLAVGVRLIYGDSESNYFYKSIVE